jgi:small-conductance mechanosensitive channel
MPRLKADQEQFDELCFYTLAQPDARFIHQHVVDAFAAQHADQITKPITVAFALIGLYLHVERGFSGRQVQLAHMQLANSRKQWPRFALPPTTGEMTVADVLAVPPGLERDQAIDRWSACVWLAWSASHKQVESLVRAALWRK